MKDYYLLNKDTTKKYKCRQVGSNSKLEKYSDHVEIHIRLTPDAVGQWTGWFTLNPDEIPRNHIHFTLCRNSAISNAHCIVEINTNGRVKYLANVDAGLDVEYLGFISYRI